jgi:hypothetical protein
MAASCVPLTALASTGMSITRQSPCHPEPRAGIKSAAAGPWRTRLRIYALPRTLQSIGNVFVGVSRFRLTHFLVRAARSSGFHRNVNHPAKPLSS